MTSLIYYQLLTVSDPTSPAWYVALTSIICVFAMWALPESMDREPDS
jgi:hypothetical protein